MSGESGAEWDISRKSKSSNLKSIIGKTCNGIAMVLRVVGFVIYYQQHTSNETKKILDLLKTIKFPA